MRGAVLLVHGFTGSPFEVRYLGERLAARGFRAVAPSLKGHESRDPRGLDPTRWQDWVGSASAALDALKARHPHVAVIGMSLGGLIALHLAATRGPEIAAVGSLGAPLWLPAYARVAVPIVARLSHVLPRFAFVPKVGGSDVRDPEMKVKNLTMNAFPIHALASLIAFQRIVRAELAQVTIPTFIAHGLLDRTAPFASLAEMERRIGARDLTVLELPRSGHVITIDYERERLADEVGRFLEERIP